MIERSQFAAIITAAGESTRMGRTKALVPFNGLALIDHQIACLKGFGQIIVVTGHGGDEILAHVGRALCVHNPDYQSGRSSSIEVGAKAIREDLNGALIVGVAQPLVPDILSELLMTFDPSTQLAALPVMEGRRGHPVLCSSQLFVELESCGEVQEGLRGILTRAGVKVCEVSVYDERIYADLNCPEDVEHAEPFWL